MVVVNRNCLTISQSQLFHEHDALSPVLFFSRTFDTINKQFILTDFRRRQSHFVRTWDSGLTSPGRVSK